LHESAIVDGGLEADAFGVQLDAALDSLAYHPPGQVSFYNSRVDRAIRRNSAQQGGQSHLKGMLVRLS
jgi:hypothetical protein